MEAPSQNKKRSRVDSVADTESSKVKRIRDDLLSLLDDTETVPDRDPMSHDLDSVIRSFQEEISGVPDPVETGLEVARESTELMWELEGGLTSYDPFEFGLDYEESVIISGDSDGGGEVEGGSSRRNEYLGFDDGLFDYPDLGFGSDFTWRSETLPAL